MRSLTTHAGDSTAPAVVQLLHACFASLRHEAAFALPELADRLQRLIQAGLQAGHVGSPQRGGFNNPRPFDVDLQHVRQPVAYPDVGDHAAVDTQFGRHDGVIADGADQITRLVAGRLERRTHDLGDTRVTRETEDGPARFRIPVGCAQAGEGRYQIDAGRILD